MDTQAQGKAQENLFSNKSDSEPFQSYSHDSDNLFDSSHNSDNIPLEVSGPDSEAVECLLSLKGFQLIQEVQHIAPKLPPLISTQSTKIEKLPQKNFSMIVTDDTPKGILPPLSEISILPKVDDPPNSVDEVPEKLFESIQAVDIINEPPISPPTLKPQLQSLDLVFHNNALPQQSEATPLAFQFSSFPFNNPYQGPIQFPPILGLPIPGPILPPQKVDKLTSPENLPNDTLAPLSCTNAYKMPTGPSKSFECLACHACFTRKSDLKRHQSREKRLHKCEFKECDKMFSRMDNMRTHMKKCHGFVSTRGGW
ncbi:hypothetical protein HK096_000270, partial [Nowakowskiella sp. JEL0078]